MLAGVDSGRLIDLIKVGLILDAVQTLVLDEADEMLSMGFQEELTRICDETKKRRAAWLFSATFQPRLEALIEAHLSPGAPRLEVGEQQVVNPNIEHRYALLARDDKDAFIVDYLRGQGTARGLIFCRTRAGCLRMGKELEQTLKLNFRVI